MSRTPLAYDPDAGAAILTGLPDLGPEVSALIEGTAGSSPYLAGLIPQEADWLVQALETPEAALDGVIAGLADLGAGEMKQGLRVAKRRVALITALADLGGVWPLEMVTGALTRFADAALQAGLVALLEPELRRGKVPGQGEDAVDEAAGMVLLAMGKMGAYELNYSSDIDLICLYDESRFDPDDYGEARAVFVRVTRKLMSLMSELTGDGYVFRTDLRLRPDPSVTPVCIAMEAAERYYESLGRTWERAAHIKARPSAGDLTAGTAYLERLSPFIWRKHLDFAAIQDAHDMRLRIREHKRLHGRVVLEGHNMKLGKGGIRDIEFFTQTRQIIAGGRDTDLRLRGTVESLHALAEKSWVPGDVAVELTALYRDHREVEHRLQMVADAQTHSLPKDPEGFRRLACLMGEPDVDALRSRLTEDLERAAELTEPFFEPGGQNPDADADRSEESRRLLERWRSFPALRSARAVQIFERLCPEILKRLDAAAKPDEALLEFEGFLSGLPAGVQLFSLFEANPQLIDLVVDICATAPGLARYLSRNAGVFDGVIGGGFFDPWPGQAALLEDLAGRLADSGDYEARLDATRRWQKEWHFRVGVHHLRGLIGATEVAREYTELADAVLQALFPIVVEEFSRKHGPPPGRGAILLGMGSLGAATLTAVSDLDLILIYDPQDVESSDGKRPLMSSVYYARLTKALVTALSAPMAEGMLYEVDMRLRPSGRQGPVATSWASFQSYQMTDAWTWEHLALTRARAVAVSGADAEPLSAEVEAFRSEVLAAPRDRARVLSDVADMRARLAEAKPATTPWEAKLGPGRLQDIELLGQAGALIAADDARTTAEQLATGRRAGLWDSGTEEALSRHYACLRTIQQAARLMTDRPLDPEDVGEGGRRFLLRQTDSPSIDALLARISDGAAEADARITAALAVDRQDASSAETECEKGDTQDDG